MTPAAQISAELYDRICEAHQAAEGVSCVGL